MWVNMIYGNLPASHWEKHSTCCCCCFCNRLCVFAFPGGWLTCQAKNPWKIPPCSSHIRLLAGTFLLFAQICQLKQLTWDSMQPPARIMPGILVSLLRSIHSHSHIFTQTNIHKEKAICQPRQCQCHFGQEQSQAGPRAGERFFIWQMLIKRPTGAKKYLLTSAGSRGICMVWYEF